MSKTVWITIGVPFEGTPGWGTQAFMQRETEITCFVEKRSGGQWKNSEIIHQGYHEIILAMTERPDMADFLAMLRAEIWRRFQVNVTTDWGA